MSEQERGEGKEGGVVSVLKDVDRRLGLRHICRVNEVEERREYGGLGHSVGEVK